MNKLWLIIQREYLSLVAKKSFLVMTFLIPVLIVACGCLPMLITQMNKSDGGTKETVVVIDETGQLTNAIKSNGSYQITTLKGEKGKTDPKKFFKDAGVGMNTLVVIPAAALDSAQATIFSNSTVNANLLKYVEDQLDSTFTAQRLTAMGIPAEKVQEAKVVTTVNSVKLDENGETTDSSTMAAIFVGIVLAFITYMFVLSYGAMIMNSVIEEKTNRIVEVIVSSCKPFQLMMGKIIGVALVGLTQFAIWIVLLGAAYFLLDGVGTTGGTMDTIAQVIAAVKSINVTWVLVAFVVYFIGGYLLYASLFAASGSAVDQASDASQFSMPIIMLMIVALYVGMGCIENPGGTMAQWCSIIPFTSPIVMMVRLPYEVPFWELALSVALLYGTALGMIWFSARIYRTGILRYGKKFSLKEVLSWLKSSSH